MYLPWESFSKYSFAVQRWYTNATLTCLISDNPKCPKIFWININAKVLNNSPHISLDITRHIRDEVYDFKCPKNAIYSFIPSCMTLLLAEMEWFNIIKRSSVATQHILLSWRLHKQLCFHTPLRSAPLSPKQKAMYVQSSTY